MDYKKGIPLKRKRSYRDVKETYLIICQGENTEPVYFRSFKLTSADIKAISKPEFTNILRFVEEAQKIKNQYKNDYDNYWIVIDKDDNSDEDFNNAIALAKKYGFKVAYSNQAFEFWLILHFICYIGPMHRKNYKKILDKYLGFSYNKKLSTCKKLYNALLPFQGTAIKNAETVYSKIGDHTNIAAEESSTTVHELVKSLNRYL
ncbi:MAG TPA: RloB family protein [Bacteroidales bacterium]|nr:RloB family protein [Bacteroidales bacterium]HOU30001.1 RloB family protein [Bacteroidales bacterium]HPP92205.1 RloB family protein [Bacteroidales bacterium]HQG56226.1 RloB family protein [Bacteroidales bacterium]HQK71864.1 RloB family protein [Bacteroidales bacterium]